MNDRYILNQAGEPIPESGLLKWAAWFQKANRIVAEDLIGDSLVSTLFLGLNHRFPRRGPPILWETMVFGGQHAEEQDRCSGSREQAEAMHLRMVNKVKA